MKKQENKNRRHFLLCMGGLLMMIVFAFAGPEGMLRLQDKSRLTRSVSISNTGTDYTVWKEEYETDTVRRLQNLADGIALGKQYYISEQDYEAATDGEIYSLIDEYILNTEWNYIFQDMGAIRRIILQKYGIQIIFPSKDIFVMMMKHVGWSCDHGL